MRCRTVLHAIAWWDNTPRNSNIIEPRNLSTWARRSVGNMFIVFEQGIMLTPEQYREEVAKRREYFAKSGDPIIGCPACFQPSPRQSIAQR